MASTDPQEFTVALHLLESTKVNGDRGTGLEGRNEAQLGVRQSGGLWGYNDMQLRRGAGGCGGKQFLRIFIDPVWVSFHCFCLLFICLKF